MKRVCPRARRVGMTGRRTSLASNRHDAADEEGGRPPRGCGREMKGVGGVKGILPRSRTGERGAKGRDETRGSGRSKEVSGCSPIPPVAMTGKEVRKRRGRGRRHESFSKGKGSVARGVNGIPREMTITFQQICSASHTRKGATVQRIGGQISSRSPAACRGKAVKTDRLPREVASDSLNA